MCVGWGGGEGGGELGGVEEGGSGSPQEAVSM